MILINYWVLWILDCVWYCHQDFLIFFFLRLVNFVSSGILCFPTFLFLLFCTVFLLAFHLLPLFILLLLFSFTSLLPFPPSYSHPLSFSLFRFFFSLVHSVSLSIEYSLLIPTSPFSSRIILFFFCLRVFSLYLVLFPGERS